MKWCAKSQLSVGQRHLVGTPYRVRQDFDWFMGQFLSLAALEEVWDFAIHRAVDIAKDLHDLTVVLQRTCIRGVGGVSRGHRIIGGPLCHPGRGR